MTACLFLLAISPAQADPVPMPSMTGPLAGNSNPYKISDTKLFGKIYVTGAVTAIGISQNNAASSDRDALADISNAQLFVQNTDSPFQFFLQGGAYSMPSLGTAYLRTGKAPDKTYGFLPQGYIKLVPNSSFSFQLGKLPTLFGAEYTFTFENMNIERGLLWNQEPAVSRGVQANYATGPWALSFSLNDGYYSERYNWLSGSAAYTIDSANTVSFLAGGNLGETTHTSFATPLAQNNGSIYNAIYTHTAGAWTVTPYLQYTYVPKNTGVGIADSASTYGAAVLAKYAFNDNFSLTGRAEYIGSTGNVTNLLYGAGSKAMSLTVTPTYQYKQFFGRVDASYVHASGTTAGSAFGSAGNDSSQTRLVLETGILF
jgi:hypothetical protein